MKKFTVTITHMDDKTVFAVETVTAEDAIGASLQIAFSRPWSGGTMFEPKEV